MYHSYAYFIYLLQYFKINDKGMNNHDIFDDIVSVCNNVQCANCVIIITFIYVDIRTCTNNTKNIRSFNYRIVNTYNNRMFCV